MDDEVNGETLEDSPNGLQRADIPPYEGEIIMTQYGHKRLPAVAQVIENDDAVAGIQQIADQEGANIARASCYEHFFRHTLSRSKLPPVGFGE